MNGSVAERATLENFWEKISKGGIVYLDDYGGAHPELRITINEFFRDKSEKLLHFASGNSIVIKNG